MRLSRRQFLGASAATALLAGIPARWSGGAWASDAPETPKVRIGIIALTDCSSIVMAHELGLFKKHGIESTISKEVSWAVIRDRLTLGESQATHLLTGTAYAMTMGLQGSPPKATIIPCYLNRNGQAITLTKSLLDKGAKTPAQIKPLALEAKAKGSPMTFAMTYPPGTHAMWMRFWLGSGGINPDRDVALITIPPAQMVANMKVGKMDGFCVGEPWNARAIADGIGFTAITTQQLWRDHPERVLAFTEEFAAKNPRTVKAVIRVATQTDHVGVFRQKQPGLNYVGLKTPVGRLTGEQLLELARLSERYGRGRAPTLLFATGADRHGTLPALDWERLARSEGTLVFYMAVATLASITAILTTLGRDAREPAVVVERVGGPGERIVAGRLGDIAERARRAGVASPAVLLVGPTLATAAAPAAVIQLTTAAMSV